MQILRLHHAQITIPPDQEQAARAFYCGVLGMIEVEKPSALKQRGGLWLTAGELQLHIGVEDGVDRATKAHLAYHVTDLAGWRKRLEAAGAKILESIPLSGLDRFEFRDPFGNRIELIELLSSAG